MFCGKILKTDVYNMQHKLSISAHKDQLKKKMLERKNKIYFQVFMHTANNLFKLKTILNLHDRWCLSILMQNAQPELWAKNTPQNSVFRSEVVQKSNCAYAEQMPVKSYTFYTLKTVLFSIQWPRTI